LILSVRRQRRWFRTFNRRYFGNQLPPRTRLNFHEADGYWGWVLGDAKDSCTLSMHHHCKADSRVGRIFLLHEMVHIHLDPYPFHGPRFEAEMRRLANEGAFQDLW
jgi:hypothetical protein